MAEKVTIPVTNVTKISAPTITAAKLDPATNPKLTQTTPKKLPSIDVLSRNAKDIDTRPGYSKGLEKAIGITTFFIIDAQTKTNELLYGKYVVSDNEINPIKKVIDKGIINLLEVVASVDFCNILNYAIDQLPAGSTFDPKKDPPTDSLGKKKWYVQNKAFELQKYIDGYYTSYGDAKNSDSKLGLYNLTNKITAIFSELLSPGVGLNDPDLITAYPQLSISNNFLQNSLGVFNTYTDIRQIPNSELQKIIGYVDKVRAIAIGIQGLNKVSSAVSLADTFTNGAVSNEIAKLSQLIPVDKIIPLLKSILKTAKNINSVGRKILGIIKSSQFIIKLLIGLIQVFNVIKAYFFALPLWPVPTGPEIKLNDIVQNKITELGNKKLIRRLGQINSVLSYLSLFAVSLISGMVNIIGKLELILLNIENCDNVDPSLAEEIKDTINNLVDTTNSLQKFVSDYEANKEKLNKNFGPYEIKIVDEQITDEGVPLKRRYGIALDLNGVLVAQSTPTFASLDQIIINEVKVLLSSKGLVNSSFSAISASDLEVMNESLNYIGDIDINIDNMQFSNLTPELDPTDNTNPEIGLGLNAFINNLSGGKALKRKIRKMMIKNNEQLTSELKATDPNGTYSKNIVKEKQNETNKLKVEELEVEKNKLIATLAVNINPVITAITMQKIKDINAEIKKLKNS